MLTESEYAVRLNDTRPPDPASVAIGLLTVWNWAEERKVGTTWNLTSSDLASSERELRVPDLREEKAESDGAKMVAPLLELLRRVRRWLSSCVDRRRWMNVLKWPAFSRILVTFVGPAGAGSWVAAGVDAGGAAAADCVGDDAGDCPAVVFLRQRRRRQRNAAAENRVLCFFIMFDG
ncbi:unnamed protein product [Linum tenue]|uniref:Uncharacterized protein n=1 Tax=Linum tenue TaxID=586396 RepID=A0AAV0QD47_9ROSI|nr:unnamed protein product [Linum tenue]